MPTVTPTNKVAGGPAQPVYLINDSVPTQQATGSVPGTSYTNLATGQPTTSATAAALVPARTFKRSVALKNLDTTIIVYVGGAGVTSGNGMPLGPGQSMQMFSIGAIYVVAASGTPKVAYADEYD